MQFDNLLAAGQLMQDVDILGNYPGQASNLLQRSQKPMGKGRLDIFDRVDEIPREFVKILGARY